MLDVINDFISGKLLILLSGFYTPGFEGDGLVLTQNALAAAVGDWGRTFISVALALLFKVGLRVMCDYDRQRAAAIKTPVFDSSQFSDLDLDLQAWP